MFALLPIIKGMQVQPRSAAEIRATIDPEQQDSAAKQNDLCYGHAVKPPPHTH